MVERDVRLDWEAASAVRREEISDGMLGAVVEVADAADAADAVGPVLGGVVDLAEAGEDN